MNITKTKTVIINKGAPKFYTVMDVKTDLHGTSYQANSVQDVGEYLLSKLESLKGWTLKTPAYESNPIRTAEIKFYKEVYSAGVLVEVLYQGLGFWAEDLTPAPVVREWPELNADEKLEVLKRELLKTGICANFNEGK